MNSVPVIGEQIATEARRVIERSAYLKIMTRVEILECLIKEYLPDPLDRERFDLAVGDLLAAITEADERKVSP